MNTNSNLYLRMFIECQDNDLARGICDYIGRCLTPLVIVESASMEKYWKMPEYYSLYFKLKALDEQFIVFKKIVSDCFPKENLQLTKNEAIWNKWDSSGSLFVPEARWAQLEIKSEQ